MRGTYQFLLFRYFKTYWPWKTCRWVLAKGRRFLIGCIWDASTLPLATSGRRAARNERCPEWRQRKWRGVGRVDDQYHRCLCLCTEVMLYHRAPIGTIANIDHCSAHTNHSLVFTFNTFNLSNSLSSGTNLCCKVESILINNCWRSLNSPALYDGMTILRNLLLRQLHNQVSLH